MRLIRIFYLFSECFSIAGTAGLIACAKYLCGALVLSEIDEKVRFSRFSSNRNDAAQPLAVLFVFTQKEPPLPWNLPHNAFLPNSAKQNAPDLPKLFRSVFGIIYKGIQKMGLADLLISPIKNTLLRFPGLAFCKSNNKKKPDCKPVQQTQLS